MKTVIIVQARMTSTRLPGKVLMRVMDKPLLQYQIERLRKVSLADDIVIATTINRTDDPVVDLCDRLNVKSFRGLEDDVLLRYYDTAVREKADVIIRSTADCPLIDPRVIDQIIACYKNNPAQYDFVSNTIRRTYPRGLDAELFSFEVLEKIHRLSTEAEQREHVTPYVYDHFNEFKYFNVACAEGDYSHHRWTVDQREDLELVTLIIKELYPQTPYFCMQDVIDLLDKNPEWLKINAGVKQK
ncbi:MAG: glycosyltransferase family protein [Deltaproteobacteria bacterium]|nr:glycosyltransferase family protein [Deltaproteobacteria bacterium]